MPLNARAFWRSWEHHHFPGHFGLKALCPTPFASKVPFEHFPALDPENETREAQFEHFPALAPEGLKLSPKRLLGAALAGLAGLAGEPEHKIPQRHSEFE